MCDLEMKLPFELDMGVAEAVSKLLPQKSSLWKNSVSTMNVLQIASSSQTKIEVTSNVNFEIN